MMNSAIGGGTVGDSGPVGLWTTACLTVAVFVLVLVAAMLKRRRESSVSGQDRPPAPPASFFFGHIPLMKESTTPWKTLDRVGKDYGDVMSLKLGHWCVMLNTFEAVKDAAVNYLREMAGRPTNYSIDLMSDGGKDINIAGYSHNWVLLRKMGGQNLRTFSGKKRVEEVAHLVLGKLKKELDERDGQTVNIRDIMLPAIAGILSHMCFGQEADPAVHATVMKLMGGDLYNFIVGHVRMVDIFPVLRFFGAGGSRWVKDLCVEIHGLALSELRRHEGTFDPENLRDLTDGLISARKEAIQSDPEQYAFLTDVHLYQVIINYIAGSTAGALVNGYHTAALLVSNPDEQEKIAELVTKATGGERAPSLADQDSMPYIRAAVEEILRYVCVAPIGVPHATTEDVSFRGYKIPAGTTVFSNLYDIHFGDHWDEPFAFKPERFLDAEGNFKKSDHSYPFGWGLRKCLGDVEALQISYLVLSWLAQNYRLERVPGEEGKDLFEQDPSVAAARVMVPFNVVLKKRF